MDISDSTDSTLSRRRFLRAAAATAAVAGTSGALTGSAPEALADPEGAAGRARLSFTAATNGAATLDPGGKTLVAEVQNVLWSIPGGGGKAIALTPADLEPNRPVFSPDGTQLVVCAYRGGGFHLWSLRPDGTGLRQLTDGPWDDRAPSFSPDGTRVVFASERAGHPVNGSPYRIWVLDLRDGGLAQLTGLPGQQGPLQDAAWEDFDPVFAPDGKRVLFVRGAFASGALSAKTVASVAADGSGAVTVVHTDGSAAQVMTPAVHADGRLAYLRTTGAPSASCTLVVGGQPVAIDGDVAPVPPRWHGDKLLLTVSGRFTLVNPAAPATLAPIAFTATLPLDRPRYRDKRYDLVGDGVRDVRSVHLPSLSPDGKRIAFAALNSLWVVAAEGGTPRKVLTVPPTRYVLGPTWTADGGSLVFSDDREGLLTARRLDLATGADTVLAGGGRVHPALSPDGGALAAIDMAGNLVVRDLKAGTEKVLAAPLGGGGLPGRPSWSPDGRYLAYCDRNRLNGRFREGYNLIRVVEVATGTARLHQVAAHTSIADRYDSGPVWSPDGRHFAVVVESALWLVPVKPDGTPAGAARQLTREAADHPSFSGDGQTVLYLSAGKLRLVGVDGGRARTVRAPLDYRRPRPEDTVVHAGRFWAGTGDEVRQDVDLVLRGGRITEVAPHRAGRPAARRVDASGQTVLPGLWDAHTHPWQYTYGGRQTATQLAYGITTAVSFGGFAYEQARIREAVAAGALAGPRLLATGELLDGSRVAYSMGRAHRTREGLRRSLDRAAALDWDFVKTYVRAPGWLMAEAAAFAHERLGVRSGSHLCSPGVQLNQDLTTHLQATQRLEFGHATSATGRAYQDLVEIYAKGDRFHLIATPFTAAPLLGADAALAEDPRVTAMMPPWDAAAAKAAAKVPPTPAQLATLATEVEVYQRVLAAGGLVALGTDQPLVAVGLHLHLGLRALHRNGFTPAQALRTVTSLPARVFGQDRDLGTLEVGKVADVTIVDGDPFTDFSSLVRTSGVLRGGVHHTTADLVEEFQTGASALAASAQDHEHWHQVTLAMRKDSCCDPEC
ncbi:Tol biopolymer transport system component [Crossiella equi]|uniref:Tol biopolymer transport system component n=1 Tax=Crossiella equi TaxID=130796 RepID=A0ABS5A9R6_9PSEU|nr:amidohydrolase family protein [Crossiella equi]MBP2473344.1 Tol biopolymer transport system component [Crossiella equi]